MLIGPVKIKHSFTLAALAGYSDLPMRRIARRFGAAYALSAVVLDRSVTHPGEWQERLLRVEPDDHPVGAQLMGDDPDDFVRAAELMAEAGYDVIDLNFACPANRILNRCHGGALLGRPARALEIIRRVAEHLGERSPLTVKLRRGFDDSPSSEREFFTILDGTFDYGAAAVTVHPRSVEQRFRGRSDWGLLTRVKKHVGARVVIGSGDLFTAADCLRMIAETGVDGVALARGAMGNPWIFRDCLALARGEPWPTPPSLAEQRQVMADHFTEAVRYYGRESAGRAMRKHAMKYSKLHPHPRAMRVDFVDVKTTEQYEAAFARWYGDGAFLDGALP